MENKKEDLKKREKETVNVTSLKRLIVFCVALCLSA
jgi:hypothetical protein